MSEVPLYRAAVLVSIKVNAGLSRQLLQLLPPRIARPCRVGPGVNPLSIHMNTNSGISDSILVYLHEPPGPNSHPFEDYPLAGSAEILCTGGPDVIRKEARPTLSLAFSPSRTLSPSLSLSLYKYVQSIAAVG